jgi:hypothetical protein
MQPTDCTRDPSARRATRAGGASITITAGALARARAGSPLSSSEIRKRSLPWPVRLGLTRGPTAESVH